MVGAAEWGGGMWLFLYLNIQRPNFFMLRYRKRLQGAVENPPSARQSALRCQKSQIRNPNGWHFVHKNERTFKDAVHGLNFGVECISTCRLQKRRMKRG
jgi:hypothetical protein